MPVDAETQDFFRMRLDHFMDQRHPLVVLASRLPWQEIEASLAHLFARKAQKWLGLSEQLNPDR